MHYFKTNKIIKKSLLLNNIKYLNNNVKIFDGYLFTIPSLLDAKKVYFLNENLYNYVERINSQINTRKSQQVISNHEFFLTMKKVFFEKQYFDRDKIFATSICLSSLNRVLMSDDDYNIKYKYLKLLRHLKEFDLCLDWVNYNRWQLNEHQQNIINLFEQQKYKKIIKNYTRC